jgi:hypothetical protein
MIDSIVRFLENKNQQSINKRLRTFLVIGLILLVAGSGILLTPEAKAKSGGLKVFVHVSGGGGNVCVRTASEDAGCKSLHGAGTAEFEFSPGAVAVGQKFTACVDQTCTTGTNSAAKKPENVYLSSSGGGSSNIVTPKPQLQQPPPSPQNTVRLNWKGMCSAVQSALYPSCDTLVNSDGTLSPEGQKAWICIRNGGALALGAMALGVSPAATIAGLSSLSNPTSCGKIVNFNILPTIPNLKTIINLIPNTIGSNTVSR